MDRASQEAGAFAREDPLAELASWEAATEEEVHLEEEAEVALASLHPPGSTRGRDLGPGLARTVNS